MSALILLPIHLFRVDILAEHIKKLNPNTKSTSSNTNTDNPNAANTTPINIIYILEEPVYFGDRETHLNFNKIKLIYHRATMQYYYDYLVKHLAEHLPENPISIKYIEYSDLASNLASNLAKNKKINKRGYNVITQNHKKIYMFDPVDDYLETKYRDLIFHSSKSESFLETPLFLTSNADLESYHKSKAKSGKSATPEHYYHASFYIWQRDRLDILAKSKTYDTENRNMMPLDTQVPNLPIPDSTTQNTKSPRSAKSITPPIHNKYITAAIKYVDTHWPDNLAPIYVQNKERSIIPESILFPITHEGAAIWLDHFCRHKLHLFGKYEDSIDSVPRNFLFHSAITPMLNIGLITPNQVINVITAYYNKHKSVIGIANYEAFIRQVIGWREYQRYIYKYAGKQMRAGNHFNNKGRLSDVWYNATTGIKPVDDAVRMAINDGYIHHILRLMVVGNMMNLVGIHPDDVYKWFMEFSLDSYDWVMVGNVYSMALWADGGLTMRKPYISGSGYIIKMGNFTKEQLKLKDEGSGLTWPEKWDVLFHSFIDRNQVQLRRTYYAGLVKAWGNKGEKEREKEMIIASKLIKLLSV